MHDMYFIIVFRNLGIHQKRKLVNFKIKEYIFKNFRNVTKRKLGMKEKMHTQCKEEEKLQETSIFKNTKLNIAHFFYIQTVLIVEIHRISTKKVNLGQIFCVHV